MVDEQLTAAAKKGLNADQGPTQETLERAYALAPPGSSATIEHTMSPEQLEQRSGDTLRAAKESLAEHTGHGGGLVAEAAVQYGQAKTLEATIQVAAAVAGRGAGALAATIPGRLPRPLRNKVKRIENAIAAGGRRGISGAVSEDDAVKLGERFVGPGYTVTGEGRILKSSDGLRHFRLPSEKRGINPLTGEPFSRTGVQVNFESRAVPDGRFPNNVHLDVIQ